MTESNRRDFLKAVGISLAGSALCQPNLQEASAHLAAGAPANPPAPRLAAIDRPWQWDIPAQHGMVPHGFHAYADRVSVAPGETIRFHTSSTLAFDYEVCRLGTDVDDPDGDQVLQAWPAQTPFWQPVFPGSYIHVKQGLVADMPLDGFTMECWVRPWGGECPLFSQFSLAAAGYFLLVNSTGQVNFYLGDGGAFDSAGVHATAADAPGVKISQAGPPAIPTPEVNAYGGRGVDLAPWQHLAATWDGTVKKVWLNGTLIGEWPFAGPVRPGSAVLRLGAFGAQEEAVPLANADLAQPAIYSRALSAEEIAARVAAQGLQPPPAQGLLAWWPLDEERGPSVRDASGQGHDGQIINHGTWMIGGPSFAAGVDRFAPYDPASDANRGHGLRLSKDDLYDCRWQPTLEFTVPADAQSGLYVGRARLQIGGQTHLHHTLFVVTKPPQAAKAPIAFLCSTNTYRAYAGSPFAATWPGVAQSIGHAYINARGSPFESGNVDPSAEEKLPEFSVYWQHDTGQGSYQMGLNMPWPIAGPYTFHQNPDWKCSHLAHADRLTLSWLEREGYPVDVYSDLDLHRNPELLRGYKVLFIVGHSEYWSLPALAAVDAYLKQGGNIACLSGNTMFWRVTFNDDYSVMECRKADAPGSQIPPERRGELWHSHDGQRGGLLRECGHPAWHYLGLEYMTVHGVGEAGIGPYLVRAADHPFFNHPHQTGLANGDKLGESPTGMPELIGHEGDVRVSTLAKVTVAPVAAGAVIPDQDPPGITLLADGFADWKQVKEGAPWDYLQRPVLEDPQRTATQVACEMILWQRPDGGQVFHAGSVSAGRGFANDPRFGALFKNALHAFGVPHRNG